MSKSNQQSKTEFTKEQYYEWRKLWQSEMGQIALDRIASTYERFIALAMQADRADLVTAFVGRAAGVQSVIEDIQAVIEAANRIEKEDKEGKTA